MTRPAQDDRRSLKLRKKTDHRGVEYGVVKSEFSIDRKRANESGGGIFFEGYASILNTPDSYKDIILPGAFKKTIKQKGPKLDKKTELYDSDIVSLWQHNPDWPFGLPVHMEEDSKGLYHRTQISDTAENRDRVTYMEDRIVKGESIGFVTIKADWDEEDEDDFWPTRYIKEVDLWEISPVTFPAHSDALTEIVRRNRELALVVESADHGKIIEMATKMKGITVPAVEESIAVLSQVATILKKSQEEEEDGTEEGEGESPGEEGVEENSGENPIENGDTSEEDSELVKALENMAFERRVSQVKRAIRTRR